MARNVAIVFGTKSGIISQIIVTDSLKSLVHHHLRDGEELIVFDQVAFKKDAPDLNDAYAAVAEYRGEPSMNPIHAIVGRDGAVKKIVLADPEFDKPVDLDDVLVE